MTHTAHVGLLAILISLASLTARAQAPPPCPGTTLDAGALHGCLSPSSTLTSLATAGREHLAVGSILEGYAVCAAGRPVAFDYGATTAGFEAPTSALISGNLIITRSTTDGLTTLNTGALPIAADRRIGLFMTLTNVGPPAAYTILRSADLDMQGTPLGDRFDRSAMTAWARQIDALTLSAETVSPQPPWLPAGVATISIDRAPATCTPVPTPTPTTGADAALSVRVPLGTIPTGESRTVAFTYRAH